MKISKVIKTGLFIIIVLILVLTNPTQADLKKHIKEQEGMISLVSQVETKNFIVFSVYRVEISSFNQGLFASKIYIGLLNHFFEFEGVKTDEKHSLRK